MKHILFFALLLPFFVFSQAPATYYDGTADLNGYALKSKLHDLISVKTISWNYGDLPEFYGLTDLDHYYDYDATNDIYLLDIYSNNPTGTTAYHYTKEQLISSAATEGLGYNREHMMPQSSFNSNYPMYSDLFFVIPTDAKINQLRSNYPYAMAGATNYYTFTNGSKISKNGTPGSGYTGRVYEPIDEFKGDIARSLLYFAVRYEGKLNAFNFYNGTSPANDTSPLDGTEEKAFEDWYLAMLLQWNQQDPVSQREIERNNKAYEIQGNRNPFIDHPEWVNLIWNQTPTVITPQAPANLSPSKISAYFVTLNWSSPSDPNILGYKIYQNGVYVGYTKNTDFTVDHLLNATLYQFTVRAYYRDYTESPESAVLEVTTLIEDVFAKDLMITKYIEGTDNNKALQITNRTGHAVDLNNYRIGAQFYNSANSNYYFPAPYELEGTIQHNETFIILNPRANLSCVTNDDAKFLSASPQMSFDGSNYLELRYKTKTVDAIGTKSINNFSTLGDVSLYRISSVTEPNSSFDLSEWQSYATDYCEDLGTLAGSDISITANESNSIYPNPVLGNTLFVKGKQIERVKSASIYDFSGKQLMKITDPFKNRNSIDVEKIPPGVYLLKLDKISIKFIKK